MDVFLLLFRLGLHRQALNFLSSWGAFKPCLAVLEMRKKDLILDMYFSVSDML